MPNTNIPPVPTTPIISVPPVNLPVIPLITPVGEFRADHQELARKSEGTTSSFVWTCTQWEDDGDEPIVMLVNPTRVQWSLPFRVTLATSFGGTIIHNWLALDGSSADLIRLSITMNTGRLYPTTFFSRQDNLSRQRGQQADGSNVVRLRPLSAVEKARIFYRFCQLTRIPAFTTSGSPNLIMLEYRTLLFPEIKMLLKFIEPLTFTEDAHQPYGAEYSIGVVILQMVPTIQELAKIETAQALDAYGR